MNNYWTASHGIILNEIFTALSDAGIDWLVIRNYQGLPWNNSSKDIDIAVKKKEWAKSVGLIKKILFRHGFIYYDLKRYPYILCFIFFSNDGKGFKFDIFDRNEYCGLTTHSFKELNAKKVQTGEKVYGSCELHNAMIIFTRPLLGSGRIKEKYISEIVSYAKDCPKEFESELIRLFSSNAASKIMPCVSDEKIKGTVRFRKMMLRALFVNNVKEYGLSVLVSWLNHYFSTFRTRVRMLRTTPFISVQGPDGVGKSTFIDALISRVALCYAADSDAKVHLYHHRPTMLPNLGAVGEKAKLMTADKNFTDPHRGKRTGFLSSMIRMTYYWLDYAIGGAVMRIKDIGSDKITLYDRYIYDFLIDPQRTRIYLPYWLRMLFTKMVISPRVVFILMADAQTIYERKQELSLSEIQRQLGELERLARTNKRFVVINAEQSPDKMADDALRTMLNQFVQKNAI